MELVLELLRRIFSSNISNFIYRKEINYLRNLKKIIPIILKSFIMMIYLIAIGTLIENIYVKIIVQLLNAIVIYFILNYKYILNDFLGRSKNK